MAQSRHYQFRTLEYFPAKHKYFVFLLKEAQQQGNVMCLNAALYTKLFFYSQLG